MLRVAIKVPKIDYSYLLQLLNVQPYGAPAGNIRRLSQLNLNVSYSQTDLSGLETMLEQSHPVSGGFVGAGEGVSAFQATIS